jgi:hypothetical protein
MNQVLGEIKMDYQITTKEEVHVTIKGVPTHIHHLPDGEELKAHSMGVALRLETLVRALVAQDPSAGIGCSRPKCGQNSRTRVCMSKQPRLELVKALE